MERVGRITWKEMRRMRGRRECGGVGASTDGTRWSRWGFKRNTYWKEIKSKVEEMMGESRVTNGGVKVIGQIASFVIVRFDPYENKPTDAWGGVEERAGDVVWK